MKVTARDPRARWVSQKLVGRAYGKSAVVCREPAQNCYGLAKSDGGCVFD